MATKDQKKTKRQLIAEAQQASLDGRWEDAITLNDQLIERYPREADAINRKGRALIELRQLTAARETYSEALKADPANMIARRNLQRLETLYNRAEGLPEGADRTHSAIPRGNVFVEEVGKTWVDELANPGELGQLAEIFPGEQLQLEVSDGRLVISSDDGVRLGEIEARTGRRVIELIEGGNRYEIYALGMSGQSLRVILREVYRDPSQATKIAFPRQARATQSLMRERELLFQRDEGDFAFGDEEDDTDDEHIETDDEDDETEEPDTEAAAYVTDAVAEDDEERDAM